MPPSMAASSQPALHMTAGFRIKARESGGRQRQARLMKRSPLLSGVAGEVYCTLCIHTSDTRWRDVSGRRAANAGGGSLYRSRTRWQKSQELMESRWLQLMTFQLQERVFKAEIQQTIWHYNISKYWMTVLMNWGGKDRLYFGFHVSNFEALSFTVLWAFRHADSSVFSLVLFLYCF